MAALDLFEEIHNIILVADAEKKCRAVHDLHKNIKTYSFKSKSTAKEISLPGYPKSLTLVPPKQLKRRGIQQQEGRNILLHAVAHIEYNAINLALDAAYRFRGQETQYYLDWIRVADDEARHFELIQAYLKKNDCDYGHYPAHNGLWDMAVRTQDNLTARMALVPRVLEARGLDVTPGMIEKLKRVNDLSAVHILEIIYRDEIEHVAIGSYWFKYQCKLQNLEPRSTFRSLVDTHLYGELRGPFNLVARLKAGFDEQEMQELEKGFDS